MAADLPPPSHQHRIPGEDAAFDAGARESGRRSARHADTSGQPISSTDQPAAIPPLLILLERFRILFLSSKDGPVASEDGGVATEATIELVLAVRDAVVKLWKAHEAEIKQRCGPSMPKGLIAKQEVFGFALADVLGRPLLPGDRAMRIGQNGDNAIRWAEGSKDRTGKLVLAREAATAAVRKARRAAEKDSSLESGITAAESNGKKAIGIVLATPVDLDLPNETVGAVKRKRGTASELTAPVKVEPTLEALRAAATRAEAARDTAKAVVTADERRVEQAERCVERSLAKYPTVKYPAPPPPLRELDDAEKGTAARARRLIELMELEQSHWDACQVAEAKADGALVEWEAAHQLALSARSVAHDELAASQQVVEEKYELLLRARIKVAEAEWREADDAVRAADAKIARTELALERVRCTCKECASGRESD